MDIVFIGPSRWLTIIVTFINTAQVKSHICFSLAGAATVESLTLLATCIQTRIDSSEYVKLSKEVAVRMMMMMMKMNIRPDDCLRIEYHELVKALPCSPIPYSTILISKDKQPCCIRNNLLLLKLNGRQSIQDRRTDGQTSRTRDKSIRRLKLCFKQVL